MITLGLGKILPMRREPPPSRAETLAKTLSEAVERLKLPSEALQSLSEAAAWCLNRSLPQNNFRSSELDPSAFLKVPSFDELGIGLWLERERESYQLAVDAINVNRSTLVRDTNIELADPALLGSKGRLLLYEPLETVTDGASEASSRGFFDIEDAPPWDTWFLYSSGSIVCWVPEAMVEIAQEGIDANPVDCIHWCNWRKL
ncbi:hypothetical protein HDF16_001193 [Granulicella aggregans]|uniref:Uncharacterized protein n=1 Tax=Granulicella aggregans TaxID=474949 RepID=A0A7W8E244_9BACT|nr:hypothetical protein [Granulicella aggregans]